MDLGMLLFEQPVANLLGTYSATIITTLESNSIKLSSQCNSRVVVIYEDRVFKRLATVA